MKFIVDAQLPPILARLLCELGQEAVAVRDVGLRDADDEKSGSTHWLNKLLS